MSVDACADLVRRGDPDRFLATMATPPAARAVLFPLYAFNVEVSRAPWLTAEPLIAEMRLQWWRDALDEIATGGIVRRHDVVVPLAGVIDAKDAADLDRLITARKWDIERDPFAGLEDLERYLSDTGGTLMAVATRALGGADTDRAATIGTVGATANYLMAVPALIAEGRQPLVGDAQNCIRTLAERQLDRVKQHAGARNKASAALRRAWLSAWRARAILRRAAEDPDAVLEGRLAGSEFRRRTSLLAATRLGI
ncbi:squalene/phytoene synthase family protein [Oceaniglobus indicus]|uniref:squalene/phytoene synthase family protein n=1 Tax=Oceaniglobus indicus TaxID=2047749 RepID=UPI000C181334|nr:squalene/phytoene synthase family protein [Oceaniglobus indicus]